MWITIPTAVTGDDFPVYDASDTYPKPATVPRLPQGDQLEFYRSMLHKKRTARKSAYGKTAAAVRERGAAMSLAFTVVVLSSSRSSSAGGARARARSASPARTTRPSRPRRTRGSDGAREQNAQRKAAPGVARRRGPISAPPGRRALPEAPRDAHGGTQCRKVGPRSSSEAAALLASLGRVRCANAGGVTRAALVSSASRVPDVIGCGGRCGTRIDVRRSVRRGDAGLGGGG